MSKVKKSFKRSELGQIQSDLVKLKLVCGTAIAYSVLSFEKAINAELDDVEKHQQMPQTPESELYREELHDLYMASIYKDNDGKPLRNQQGQFQLQDPKKFQADTMALLEKYPAVKADIEAHEKEYQEYLDETITIEYDSLVKEQLSTELNATEISLLAIYWTALAPSNLVV